MTRSAPRIVHLPLFLAALFLPGSVVAQTKLQWRFTPGAEWKAEISQEMSIDTIIAGKSSVTSTESTMYTTWKIEAVDDAGTATIAQTCERITVKSRQPKGDPIEFDTNEPKKAAGDAKVFAEELASMSGSVVRFTMTPRGEVENVKADESLLQAHAKRNVGKIPGMYRVPVELETLYQYAALPLPEKELQPGEEWDRTEILGGSLKQTRKFRFIGPDAETPSLMRIEATTKLEPSQEMTERIKKDEAARKTPRIVGMPSVSVSLIYRFDAEAGCLVNAESNQTIDNSSTLKETAVQTKLYNKGRMTLKPVK